MTDAPYAATPLTISLDAAAIITERSKRTWYRKIEDGQVTKLDTDPGLRTLVALADVEPQIVVAMTREDLEVLAAADSGDPKAQADMGEFFLAAAKPAAAHYWIDLATRQDEPNAMQTLARCYAAGQGVPQDDHLAIMWLAKAAAHGNFIATAQIAGIRSRH